MLVIPAIDLERGRSRIVYWPGAAAGTGAPTDRPERIVEELAAAGEPMFAPLNDLDDLTVVDLPTGHWPMLSRPTNLADLIAVEADRD